MRAVNLLPADAYAERHWWSEWTSGLELGPAKSAVMGTAAAAVLAAVLLGFLYVHEHNLVHHRQNQLASVNQRVASAEASVAAAQAAQALATARLSSISGLDAQRVVWENILRDLAHVLPGNVWLSNLQAESAAAATPAPTTSSDTSSSGTSTTATTTTTDTTATAPAPAPAPPPTTFTVTGFTGSQRAVALVLDRLALLPWLSDITLQSSTRAAGSGSGAVTFSIQAGLNGTGVK